MLTEDILAELLLDVPELCIVEHWVSGDVRVGRDAEKWLNVIMRKET